MVIYFALAVCVVLLIAIGRVFVEYFNKSDSLTTTVQAHQRLIDEHKRETDQMKARNKHAREQIHALTKQISDTDARIQGWLDNLHEVNDQLERRRPKARQVSIDREQAEKGEEDQDA